MTFIQPQKYSSLFNIILAALVVAVLGAAVALIMVYNDTVRFAHATTDSRTAQKALENENSELKRSMFASFDPVRMAAFAEERGMISDRKPQYISLVPNTDTAWLAASQY